MPKQSQKRGRNGNRAGITQQPESQNGNVHLDQEQERQLQQMLKTPEGQRIITQVSTRTSSGPLPAPDVLRDYDLVLPGMAERVTAMAEREQAHRHSMDSIGLNGAIKRDSRGQRYGLTVAIVFALVSLGMAWLGHPVAAGIIGSADLVAIVSIFVIGRRGERRGTDSE